MKQLTDEQVRIRIDPEDEIGNGARRWGRKKTDSTQFSFLLRSDHMCACAFVGQSSVWVSERAAGRVQMMCPSGKSLPDAPWEQQMAAKLPFVPCEPLKSHPIPSSESRGNIRRN